MDHEGTLIGRRHAAGAIPLHPTELLRFEVRRNGISIVNLAQPPPDIQIDRVRHKGNVAIRESNVHATGVAAASGTLDIFPACSTTLVAGHLLRMYTPFVAESGQGVADTGVRRVCVSISEGTHVVDAP